MSRWGQSERIETCIWCGQEKPYGEPCECDPDEINRQLNQLEEERRENEHEG